MSDLHDASFTALLAMQQAVGGLDDDCFEPRCADCKPWRGMRKAIAELSEALDARGDPVAYRFKSPLSEEGQWEYGKEPPVGSGWAIEPLYTHPNAKSDQS